MSSKIPFVVIDLYYISRHGRDWADAKQERSDGNTDFVYFNCLEKHCALKGRLVARQHETLVGVDGLKINIEPGKRKGTGKQETIVEIV